MAFLEILTGIMYILIFSVIGIVIIKLIHDKIKYGRFFEEEDVDQKQYEPTFIDGYQKGDEQ